MQTEKKEFWLRHIEEARKFNGTQREYCAAQGIKATSLSAYKSAFRKGRQPRRRRFAKVEVMGVASLPQKQGRALPDPKWLANFLSAWVEHA